MKRFLTFCVSILLAICLVGGTVTVFADGNNDKTVEKKASGVKAPSFNDIKGAMKTFADAIGKFTSDVDKKDSYNQILERFSGVNGIIDGGFAILKMTGVIEDGNKNKMEQIISEVKSVQDTLKGMETSLNDVSKKLSELSAGTEEKDRQNKAMNLLSSYRNFRTDYEDSLDKYIADYQTKINNAVRDWWNNQAKKGSVDKGCYVLFTDLNGKDTLTYNVSTAYNQKSIPDTADNGEKVNKAVSIGVSAEVLKEIGRALPEYNIDTYADSFRTEAAGILLSHLNADDGKINADHAAWSSLSDDDKKAKAAVYAQGLLDTVRSQVAISTMKESGNAKFASGVNTAYKKYCENLLTKDSGIDALINVEYLTHGFEGEVSEEIQNFCDANILKAGFYGNFALSVASQSGIIPKSDREQLRDTMVNTINFLDRKKQLSLTGEKNYCYLTGTLVDFETRNLTSSVAAEYKVPGTGGYGEFIQMAGAGSSVRASKYNISPWKIYEKGKESKMPTIMNDTCMLVLYHHYQRQNESGESFASFLNKNGVNIDKAYNGKLMTVYTGVQNFSLRDNLSMEANNFYGSYIKTGNKYAINDGTNKMKDQDIQLHDKIVYNYMDLANGGFQVNQTAAARAAYFEDHWFWSTDEGALFTTGANVKSDSKRTPNSDNSLITVNDTKTISTDLNMLSLSPLGKGEAYEDELYPVYSPLESFDEISVMQGGSDPVEAAQQEGDLSGDVYGVTEEYDINDAKVAEGIEDEIDAALARARAKGIDVKLSDEERQNLTLKMRDMIDKTYQEAVNNKALDYTDPFHIDDNDEAKMALYRELVNDGDPITDQDVNIIADNIVTYIVYEAGATVEFEAQGDKIRTNIYPAYDVKPQMLVYDSVAEEYISMDIDNDTMAKLDLKMDLRIPAGLEKTNKAKIRHYNNIIEQEIIEDLTADVLEQGDDRYALVQVTSASPFALVSAGESYEVSSAVEVSSPDTADYSSRITWIVLIALSGMCIAGLNIMTKRKHRAG